MSGTVRCDVTYVRSGSTDDPPALREQFVEIVLRKIGSMDIDFATMAKVCHALGLRVRLEER